jgi:ketosteroid isomerase-like protein
MKLYHFLGPSIFIGSLILFGGCLPSSATSPTSFTPTSDAAQAIAELIAAHRTTVVADDVQGVLNIWAEDGVITDANHTPDDPTDDHVWRGLDAVLSYYTTILFPLYLDEVGPVDTVLTVKGTEAVMTGTTKIGDELSPGGERWTFTLIDGEWRVTGMTFNLEPRH